MQARSLEISTDAGGYVEVHTPQAVRLAALLNAEGGTAPRIRPKVLRVTGVSAPRIAEVATRGGLLIYKLVPHPGALEDADTAMAGERVECEKLS